MNTTLRDAARVVVEADARHWGKLIVVPFKSNEDARLAWRNLRSALWQLDQEKLEVGDKPYSAAGAQAMTARLFAQRYGSMIANGDGACLAWADLAEMLNEAAAAGKVVVTQPAIGTGFGR